MPGRSQVHAWSPEEIERLSQVPVPAKIKCGHCHKNVIHTRFSTKQLTDLRYHLKTTGKMCAINCKPCTGQPMVEVECVMCRKTKGLEEFAKSQRAKPDSAVCSSAQL
jgi:DNA repair protein RAD7